jgi:hypothetical protein
MTDRNVFNYSARTCAYEAQLTIGSVLTADIQYAYVTVDFNIFTLKICKNTFCTNCSFQSYSAIFIKLTYVILCKLKSINLILSWESERALRNSSILFRLEGQLSILFETSCLWKGN